MDDLAMTCIDVVNALKMLRCSEKHPVSRDNYGYTRYKIQDTRFFISGKLPIVHDYIQCLIKC